MARSNFSHFHAKVGSPRITWAQRAALLARDFVTIAMTPSKQKLVVSMFACVCTHIRTRVCVCGVCTVSFSRAANFTPCHKEAAARKVFALRDFHFPFGCWSQPRASIPAFNLKREAAIINFCRGSIWPVCIAGIFPYSWPQHCQGFGRGLNLNIYIKFL